MKKQLLTLAFAILAPLAGLHADTSYLLIQGPFGSGGSVETFKWQVNYENGVLVTGQDLLVAVFGNPSLSGTYNDGFGGTYNRWAAGNSTQGVEFIDFAADPEVLAQPFAISFTFASTTVTQDASYSPGWVAYYAGGGSNFGNGYDNNGAWTFGQDGSYVRTLVDGSFDAWVFGPTFGSTAEVTGAGNTPTTSDFAGATVVNAVPEPAGATLLALCGGGFLGLYRRRRA